MKIINIEKLYILFLTPLFLMFATNVFTVDLVTYERIIVNGDLIYISILSMILILIFSRAKIRIDYTLLILLSCFYAVILLSTVVNMHIDTTEQLTLKKIIQLIITGFVSYLAYIIGRNTPINSNFFLNSTRWLLFFVLLFSILIAINEDNIFIKRPFAWSFYFLLFFYIWFLYIDNENIKIKNLFILVLLAMALLSGSRSVLIVMIILLLQPLKLKMILYLVLIFTILFVTVYINVDLDNFRLFSKGLETSRTEVWEKVIFTIENYNSFFIGNGVFLYDFNVNKYESITVPHNTFLMLFIYSGIIGSVIGIMIIFYIFSKLYRNYFLFSICLIILMFVNDIPLFPTTYSRMFESIIIYFLLGTLIYKNEIQLKKDEKDENV